MRGIRGAAIATAAGIALLAPSGAHAATASFAYTGEAQTWTVPSGITSATFDLSGAAGATTAGAAGGLGGRVQATIAVTPGEVLQIMVGGAGGVPGAGFNGGGAGGDERPAALGGGGGGGTDVRRCATASLGTCALDTRVLVAGGAGGGGAAAVPAGDGGAGGGLTGGTGEAAFISPGGGGTQTVGGHNNFGNGAFDGSLGTGADGEGSRVSGNDFGGGGGGGGLWGGAAGAGSSGGGGGSGYGPSSATQTSGVRSGNGALTITYGAANPKPCKLIDVTLTIPGLPPIHICI